MALRQRRSIGKGVDGSLVGDFAWRSETERKNTGRYLGGKEKRKRRGIAGQILDLEKMGKEETRVCERRRRWLSKKNIKD
jgi:hypothetical protein